MISWILVESYQHGRLIQVSFLQSVDEANEFTEETDPKELRRLTLMLADLMNGAGNGTTT
jgi:hypothetical protein